MENHSDQDLAAEYYALKAANDRLREWGKQWLWNALDRLSSEISRELTDKANQAPLQVGRQEWQFTFEGATLVGDRFGARCRTNTLVVEIGWPRLPQHGYIKDGGLARARIGFSQNVMIEPRTVAELVLRKNGEGDPLWYVITNKKPGERLTESRLRSYLEMLLIE
jgi:hypothetical protein